MLRTEKVLKEEILTDRQLEPGDLEWINEGPNFYPSPMPLILVDQNYRLLDGLRRLQAFGNLEMVPVYVSDSLVDSYTYIQAIPDGKPTTPRRAWDLFRDLELQRAQHVLKTRSLGGHGKPRRGRNKKNLSRRMIAQALGMSDHQFQSITYLYGRAYGSYGSSSDEMELALKSVKRLDAGYNIYTVIREYQEAIKEQNLRITSEREQRATLGSITASLSGMIHTLQDIGRLHPKITAAEAAQWYPTLAVARAEIRRIASIVNERAKS